MGKITHNVTGSKLVLEYLEKYPDLPNLTLARKIVTDNPLVFTNIESCRASLRFQRGARGDLSRSKSTNKEHVKPKGFGSNNPYNMPTSFAEKRIEYKLPIANNNILLLSDLHIPYHDVPAINCAIQYGKENKVNTIIINGDLLDFHNQSRFEKDPRARSTKEEFDTCRAILEVLRAEFPKADIIFGLGNHDVRYERWLYLKCPEIFDDSYYHLEERLRLNDLKIKNLPHAYLIKAGKLHIAHGDTIVKGIFAPVNSARGAYMKVKSSIIIGHTHSVSEHVETNLTGETIGTWSTGCLCSLYPQYDPHNTRHRHGFAHITTEKNGNYHVNNFKVQDGKIL